MTDSPAITRTSPNEKDSEVTQPHQSEDATMTRITDAYMAALAQAMAPSLDRAATCRATGNHRVASNDEPELFVDRGPLTQPAELTDDAAFAAFDLARNVDKGPTLARRDDQQAAALDWQALDVIRKAGL